MLNAQTMSTFSINDLKCRFSKQSEYEKKESIIELGNVYCKTAENDTALRRQIVCFLLDSIIDRDINNSALASKILMQYTRINEYDSICINKLLFILNEGYCNFDIVQLVGCIGDKRFIKPIYNNYASSANRNNIEVEMLKNTLVRLGCQEMIEDKMIYLHSILNQNNNPIKQEFADAIRAVNYINSKVFYDLLLNCIVNMADKTIIVGDYGGDPFGGDDNIYCSLHSFLLELLSNAIVDFPIKQFSCLDDKQDLNIEIVKKWLQSNNDYQILRWHPYYGYNYMFWK